MAFKMKHGKGSTFDYGNDSHLKQVAPSYKKDKDGKTVEITGGNKNEKISDLQDRIGFIEEDIFNADGKMTPTQRADLANLKQKLRAIRKG